MDEGHTGGVKSVRPRGIVVVIAAAGGLLTVAGCLLGALFEIQGFGTPRDADPRRGRLALFALGIAAGVAVPLALWRMLLPDGAPATAILAAVVAGVLVVSLLGLSLAAG